MEDVDWWLSIFSWGAATLGPPGFFPWAPSYSPPSFLPISSLLVCFSVSFLSCWEFFLVLSRALFSSLCLLSLSDVTSLVFQMLSVDWWLPNYSSGKISLLGSRFSICVLIQHSNFAISGPVETVSEANCWFPLLSLVPCSLLFSHLGRWYHHIPSCSG